VQVSLFFVVVFSVSCGYGHLPLRGAVQMTLNTPGTPLISVLAVPWSSGQRMFDEVLMTKAQQGHWLGTCRGCWASSAAGALCYGMMWC